MPFSIPTAYAIRFVSQTNLKDRVNVIGKSYKFQIGSFFGLNLLALDLEKDLITKIPSFSHESNILFHYR